MSMPFPLPVACALLAAAVIIAALGLRKSRTLTRPRDKAVVLALRVTALLVAGVILFNLSRSGAQTNPPAPRPCILLVDKSLSMAGARAEFADGVVASLRKSSLSGRIEALRCGDRLAALDAAPGADGESRLCEALSRTVSDGSHLPAAVVLVSDGCASDRERMDAALRTLVDTGVPVCTVPATAPLTQPANLRVVACRHETNLRPGETFTLNTDFSCTDATVAQGRAAVKDATGAEIAQATLRFVNGKAAAQFALTMPMNAAAWRVEIDPLPGEAWLGDNKATLPLDPRGKPLRVLYMEGSPESIYSPEIHRSLPVSQFLPRIWKAAGMDVELYVTGDQNAQQASLYRVSDSRRGFCPTKEELMGFDVVICSDVSRTNFSDAQIEWVRELVAEKGGGFLMIGGDTSFGDGGWYKTAWDKLIPFRMTGFDETRDRQQGVNIMFDKRAYDHPVLRIDDNPERNAAILKRGVIMGGSNLVKGLKPGATALAWHSAYTDMPMLAVQSYGRGRTMAFTSDAAGGWGERQMMQHWGESSGGRGDNRYYRRLWTNAVRWLGENRLGASGVSAELKPSSVNLDAGEDCRFVLRLVDLPEESVASVTLETSDGRRLAMGRAGAKSWSAHLPAQRDGVLDATAVMRDTTGKEVGRAAAQVAVHALNPEWRDAQADTGFLDAVAKASGGKVCADAAEVESFLAPRLTPATTPASETLRVPLWDRAWLLALLVALLCGEWAWRKKCRS